MVFIILIGSAFLFLYSVHSLYRVLFGVEKVKYWNGPAPKLADKQKNRQRIVEFISDYPDSGLADTFPDLAREAHTVKLYKDLQALHAAGILDDIDYQLALEDIAGKVDISELTYQPPKILPQRFF